MRFSLRLTYLLYQCVPTNNMIVISLDINDTQVVTTCICFCSEPFSSAHCLRSFSMSPLCDWWFISAAPLAVANGYSPLVRKLGLEVYLTVDAFVVASSNGCDTNPLSSLDCNILVNALRTNLNYN